MGLLPSISQDLRVTIPEVGYVISAYALGVVVGAPMLTVLGRNLAPKQLLMLLMVLFTVFNTLSAFAPTNTVLFFTRLLAGLPHGAFFGWGRWWQVGWHSKASRHRPFQPCLLALRSLICSPCR
ncbi:MFS transporter [Hymenobacter cellulosilyticus]|uniref:MFS transporter n=2 Tax=Hymenobacter cellulosilyticus TaxID=2932248 RepID=A0A8T9QHE3_9BACT|nr:MFS transporter [Hymenobacter cellulosilyticus]